MSNFNYITGKRTAKAAKTFRELMSSVRNKNISSDDTIDLFKRLAVGAGLVSAGGAGLAVAKEKLIDPVAAGIQMNISKRQMRNHMPSLKQEDDKTLNNYFNVVKRFSPKAASNPLVAGALVNKMIQFGGVDHKLVQDLTGIQKNIHSMAPKPAELNIGGLSALMGLGD